MGNEHFQQGKFDLAVECYTEAIEACPTSDTEELPKFYQNRAAAYENLVSLKSFFVGFIKKISYKCVLFYRKSIKK